MNFIKNIVHGIVFMFLLGLYLDISGIISKIPQYKR
jgi:hypothetical protein